MGSDITRSVFTDEDFTEFHRRLRDETKILLEWCRKGVIEKSSGLCGMELEAWLVDEKGQPKPCSEQFLFHVNNDMVVPELSRFNFELNSVPQKLGGDTFSKFHSELTRTWGQCKEAADNIGAGVIAIGSLPTITDELMTIDHMSPHQRFYALNEQVLRLREGKPLEISIEGKDKLHVTKPDIMLEAAATSLQIHLQVNLNDAPRFYNAAQIVSAPMAALSANSPYLFGKDLWAETRIPVFEKSVSVASFRDVHGTNVGRVTFGTGYIKHSIIEPFLENLDGYPVLLPFTADVDPGDMHHLRLQNGTIWRWNRPLVGFDFDGKPHIRIEHRVMSAPPSFSDTLANMAFFLGAVHALAERPNPPEEEMPFEVAEKNFYEAAKYGMEARINWFGKELPVQDLLKEELLPLVKNKLLEKSISAQEVDFYIDDVLKGRVENGQTGAAWQKSFVAKHGPEFNELVKTYIENQNQDKPIYLWTV